MMEIRSDIQPDEQHEVVTASFCIIPEELRCLELVGFDFTNDDWMADSYCSKKLLLISANLKPSC